MKLKKLLQHLMAIVFALTLVLPAMAQNSKKPNAPNPKLLTQQKNGVYSMVEDAPAFPGGANAFMNYLAQNVKYPTTDLENNVQGRVIAQFVVENDGSLTEIKTVRSPSKAMADEAIRVLKKSPKWKPGKVKGKAVRAMYTVPVTFTLEA
ncbi:energy transducer TonB [Mucilaginibacter puniceus]